MSLGEDWVIQHVETFWPIIQDGLDYDSFKDICIEFSKYEDVDKVFIPFNICDFIDASKKIGFQDTRLSGMQIILFISIVEALSIRVPYKTFSEWYSENRDEQKDKKCLTSFDEYSKIHGSSKHFKSFLKKIDKEDKINLLTKIKLSARASGS